MVSHSAGAVEKMCERTLWLNKGWVVADGRTEDISPLYKEWFGLINSGKDSKAEAFLSELQDCYVDPTVYLEKVPI